MKLQGLHIPSARQARQACGQTLVYVLIVVLEHSEVYLKLCVNSNLKGGNQYCDGLEHDEGSYEGVGPGQPL